MCVSSVCGRRTRADQTEERLRTPKVVEAPEVLTGLAEGSDFHRLPAFNTRFAPSPWPTMGLRLRLRCTHWSRQPKRLSYVGQVGGMTDPTPSSPGTTPIALRNR